VKHDIGRDVLLLGDGQAQGFELCEEGLGGFVFQVEGWIGFWAASGRPVAPANNLRIKAKL
jgi:hypothetical protein